MFCFVFQNLFRRSGRSSSERDPGGRLVEVLDCPLGTTSAGVSERDHYWLQVEVEEGQGWRVRGRNHGWEPEIVRHHWTEKRKRISGLFVVAF